MEVYARLKWMETDLYPALDRALQTLPTGIDIKSLIAQAMHMGDECHNRNRGATSLFMRAIGPALARTNKDNEVLAKVIEFIDRNDHFCLNLSMPAGKAMLEAADGVEGSTIVTVMARNGTDFGIRLASMPERWFTAPAGKVQGLYFPQFTEKDEGGRKGKGKRGRGPEPGESVTVRKGDTLGRLAKAHGVSAKELALANNLSPGAKLTAGSRLVLPGGEVSPSPAARKGTPAAAAPAGGKRTARYKVHKGDTLERIARVYGVTPERLAERNRLKPGDPLPLGTVLVIPLES